MSARESDQIVVQLILRHQLRPSHAIARGVYDEQVITLMTYPHGEDIAVTPRDWCDHGREDAAVNPFHIRHWRCVRDAEQRQGEILTPRRP